MLLFLAGLLTGLAIPVCRSPRLGLSAHLTGVQSGTFLLALAWCGRT
jgi:hydroxylaminobenzene mutase